jgi:hypothetical protein
MPFSEHKLGKQDATYSSKDLRYADIRPVDLILPTLPTTWGHGMDFGNKGWLMLGNGPDDTVFPGFGGAGDCAWAGPGHETMQTQHEAGAPVSTFSGKTIIDQYAAYIASVNNGQAYDPHTGANDMGSNVRDVLDWRRTKGLLDDSGTAHKIGAYVSLETGNWSVLREASYIFESVGIGIQFPNSAMAQFDASQIWSVVPGATVEGGHYVPVVGHPYPGLWTVITWGQRQIATWSFLAKYCDEVWAYLSTERYNKVTGQTAEGYKDMDLTKFLTLV